MSVWIGTSGWSYPHWGGGRFYPVGLPARRWLEFYAARFPAVEINTSFYGLPSVKSLEHWRKSTPENFRFVAKASRFFTHRKKLADPEIHLARFLERIAVLGTKLSALLFQLPPAWNFNPVRLDALGRYLSSQTIVPGVRSAIEFRNPSWFAADSLKILKHHGIALVHSDLGGQIHPRIPTADFHYLRRHGPKPGGGFSYGERALKTDAYWIQKQSAAGQPVFCFFNNDTEEAAVRDATLLIRMLEDRSAFGLRGRPPKEENPPLPVGSAKVEPPFAAMSSEFPGHS